MSERETFNGHSVFTLSDVAMSIHKVIERTYNRQYYVKAEILKLNHYPYSGHCYPELVERVDGKIKAEMRAVIWSAKYKDINDRFLKITGEALKEDLSVLCLVTVQFSPKHGLALHIEDIEPSFTLGEMEKNRAEVIERLKKEGVFTKNKEIELPQVPKRIAVISVETSKGYSDFVNTLRNNKKGYVFHHELFPSVLQGEKAVSGMTFQLGEIRKRLTDFDVVVIVRGGGGDVGLSCYDDYRLSAAIATFPIPVLTGIGHSTNTSICDMVAFRSFITPTDVAFALIERFEEFEAAVDGAFLKIASRSQLRVSEEKDSLHALVSGFKSQGLSAIEKHKSSFSGVCIDIGRDCRRVFSENSSSLSVLKGILKVGAARQLKHSRSTLPDVFEKIVRESTGMLGRRNSECSNLSDKLELLSPQNILRRGYSITYHDGKAVTDASALSPGDRIVTVFHKGEAASRVGE